MKPRTRQNLITTINHDALDAARYSRFAARARMDEDWQLARLFQDSADTDRTDYFLSEADLENVISTSPDNLRAAVEAERKEAEIFKNFAEQAAADGDVEAAAVFHRIGREKAERLARFEAELENLGVHSDVRTFGYNAQSRT